MGSHRVGYPTRRVEWVCDVTHSLMMSRAKSKKNDSLRAWVPTGSLVLHLCVFHVWLSAHVTWLIYDVTHTQKKVQTLTYKKLETQPAPECTCDMTRWHLMWCTQKKNHKRAGAPSSPCRVECTCGSFVMSCPHTQKKQKHWCTKSWSTSSHS